MRTTRLHVNAITIASLLFLVIVVALMVEAYTNAIGCALGEIVLVSVGGMVFALKAFSSDDELAPDCEPNESA